MTFSKLETLLAAVPRETYCALADLLTGIRVAHIVRQAERGIRDDDYPHQLEPYVFGGYLPSILLRKEPGDLDINLNPRDFSKFSEFAVPKDWRRLSDVEMRGRGRPELVRNTRGTEAMTMEFPGYDRVERFGLEMLSLGYFELVGHPVLGSLPVHVVVSNHYMRLKGRMLEVGDFGINQMVMTAGAEIHYSAMCAKDFEHGTMTGNPFRTSPEERARMAARGRWMGRKLGLKVRDYDPIFGGLPMRGYEGRSVART